MGIGLPSIDDIKDAGGDLVDSAVDVVNEGGELLEDGIDKGAELLGEGVEKLSHLAEDGLDAVGLETAADIVREYGDKAADWLGADVGEMQLGETDDPKQLVHGDVGKINEGVEHLSSLGTAFGQVATALKAIETGDWVGDDADAFEITWQKKPKDWMNAEDACRGAGKAMGTYASTLEWAQGQAELAIQQWKDAESAQDAAVADYNAAVSAYNDRVDSYNAGDTTTKPTKPAAFVDPGPALFREAQDTLEAARRQRNAVAEDAQAALRDATALAPPVPEFLDRKLADLGDLYQMASWHQAHFTMGFVKGTAGLVQFVRAVNPTDPYNLTHPAEYTTAVSDLAAGLVHGTQHPGALVNALIGEGWTTDPAEALGRLAPDVLLALATDGAGLASKADDLARAADDLGRVGDDLANVGDDVARHGEDLAGWSGEGGLHLDAEANAVVDEFLENARRAEPGITDDMTDLASRNRGEMEGLDYRLKGEDSLKRKVATELLEDEYLDPADAVARMKDSVRYTMRFDGGDYSPSADAVMQQMSDRGYEQVSIKNTWGGDGYQGINSAWKHPETGQVFELQFHTKESFDAKMKAHDLYEEARLPGTTPERQRELNEQMSEIFKAVPRPEGASSVG